MLDVQHQSLRLEHKEARSCFSAAAYTATVVMVRRTLEGVCAENGVKKQPLMRALQQMQSNGLKPLRVMVTIAPGDRHTLVYELDTT